MYRFNGKEKDEESGFHYYGARYYDSGGPMWLSVDPLMDKYPSLSPYVYCANNPILYIDPDGRYIKGINGKLVTYTRNDNGVQWSSNTSKDVMRVGNTMLKTKTGTELFSAMQNTDYGIDLNINYKHSSGGKFGVTTYSIDLINMKANLKDGVNITIFEKTIKEKINADNSIFNIDEIIGATGGHEAIHATDPENINNTIYNKDNFIPQGDIMEKDVESKPNDKYNQIKNELYFQKGGSNEY